RALLLRRDRVARELRFVWPRRLPLLRREIAARLVVNERVAAGGELVHAVDARGELEASEFQGPFLLEMKDRERRPRLLDLEPLAREAREARALEVGEAAFDLQLLHRGGRGVLNLRREVLLQGGRIL